MIFKDPVLLALRQAVHRQSRPVPLGLRTLDDREYRAEALVLNDRSLAHYGVLIEEGVGELSPFTVELDPPILPLVDDDTLAGQERVLLGPLDKVGLPLVVERSSCQLNTCSRSSSPRSGRWASWGFLGGRANRSL